MFPVIDIDDGLCLQLVFKALSIVKRDRRTDVTMITTAVIHDLETNGRQHDDTAP